MRPPSAADDDVAHDEGYDRDGASNQPEPELGAADDELLVTRPCTLGEREQGREKAQRQGWN
jgi:hypothetical protein